MRVAKTIEQELDTAETRHTCRYDRLAMEPIEPVDGFLKGRGGAYFASPRRLRRRSPMARSVPWSPGS